MQACKNLGWRKIVCHVVELSDKEAFEVSLVENIQRKSINPIEEAYAFRMYVDQFGWGGVSNLAEKIGKSVSYVDKRLKLLSLPREILERISNSTISASVAEELAFIDDPDKQSEIAKTVGNEKLSSRQTRNLVMQYSDLSYNDSLLYPWYNDLMKRKKEFLINL